MWTRRHLLGAALCLGLAALGGGASANEGITLDVSVVHAKKGGATVDPALASIEGALTKAFKGYGTFAKLDAEKLELTQSGTPGRVSLPNGKTAVFAYKGAAGPRHKLELRIPESKVDVDLRAPARKVFFQAGLPHDGGILILALFLAD